MLVGGTQAIFNGRLTQLRAQAGMLSPQGQCKAFDASANGFVRGEGCGMVVLKRLADAERDGDPVWGVIRGSAINQDGASAGLTVPSAPAQVKVIQDALLQAGVEPAEVDYLEAHGTGTEVGDPIELNSAAEAYGRGRETGPAPAGGFDQDQYGPPGADGGHSRLYEGGTGPAPARNPQAPAL